MQLRLCLLVRRLCESRFWDGGALVVDGFLPEIFLNHLKPSFSHPSPFVLSCPNHGTPHKNKRVPHPFTALVASRRSRVRGGLAQLRRQLERGRRAAEQPGARRRCHARLGAGRGGGQGGGRASVRGGAEGAEDGSLVMEGWVVWGVVYIWIYVGYLEIKGMKSEFWGGTGATWCNRPCFLSPFGREGRVVHGVFHTTVLIGT